MKRRTNRERRGGGGKERERERMGLLLRRFAAEGEVRGDLRQSQPEEYS
jgi:hypothetical protein